MDLADQAVAEREALLESGKAVLQRADVVGDFEYVIEWRSSSLVEFVKQ